MNNPPKKHHYIPRHFLKEWQSTKGKVFRYQRVGPSQRLEVKEVSIGNTAFEEDLYTTAFVDGSFEYETSLVTPLVDDSGHKILNKIRNNSIFDFNNDERIQLVRYLTCLEARNPRIIEEMTQGISFDEFRQEFYSRYGKNKSVDEVVNYFQTSPEIGAFAFSLFIQQEYNDLFNPFYRGFANSVVIERKLDDDGFLTSNYPIVRYGDYHNDFWFITALSKRKAIIFGKDTDVSVYGELAEAVLKMVINLFTLRKANCAYYCDDSLSKFVEQHLSWGSRFDSEEDAKRYVHGYVSREIEDQVGSVP